MSDDFGNAFSMSRLASASLEELIEKWGDAFLVIQGRAQPTRPEGDDPTHETLETQGVGTMVLTQPVRGLVYVVVKKPASTFQWVSVGRHEGNDVHMPHASVSRFHALLRDDGGAWSIQDAKSANGTFVDGAGVVPHGSGPGTPLKPGVQIRFGEILTVFLDATGIFQLYARTRSRDPMPGIGR